MSTWAMKRMTGIMPARLYSEESMRVRLFTCLACAALVCCAAVPQPRITLNLAVVMIDGSGWTRERADGALREAGAILARCGVALERSDLVVLQVPPDLMDFSTPAARELARA